MIDSYKMNTEKQDVEARQNKGRRLSEDFLYNALLK